MKLLLDENLPVKLKDYFSKGHEVKTVREQGWSGKKNGELLGLMLLQGFEGLVTIDKNLANQKILKDLTFLFLFLMRKTIRFKPCYHL